MFLRHSFKGGVHPPAQKTPTENLAIDRAPLPKKIVLSMAQHLGAPSVPCVAVGDPVKTGQKVADKAGYVSVPLHSSITGKVTALSRLTDSKGGESLSLVIEGDGSTDIPFDRTPHPQPLTLSPEALVNILLEAGLVGLGGAAFPTHVKLSPPRDKVIDLLIVNGCECEPLLNADNRLMIEQAEAIIDGIRILKRVLGVHQALFGIEDNKPEALDIIRRASEIDTEITVVSLRAKYPQGGEKQLIKSLTGRKVPPPPALPLDVGVVVHNVATCVAVSEAVQQGKPSYERVLTVAGSAIRNPKNLIVRNGTLLSDITEWCGGLTSPPRKVVLGGPMMGVAVADAVATPVSKSTSGILFLSAAEARLYEASACIRCGACVRACPIFLMPCELAPLSRLGRFDAFKAAHGLECIECGSCAYGCPARIPLVQHIRIGKAELNARARKKG